MWKISKIGFKNQKRIHKVLLVISSLFLIMILGIAILASQLLSKDDFIVVSTTPVDSLLTEYSHFSSKGGNWVLDNADINTLAQLTIKEGTKIGPAIIKTVYVSLQDRSIVVNVYTKVFGIGCIVHSEVNVVKTEKFFTVTPQSIYVGKLHLPLDWALGFVKQYSNQYAFENGSLSIPSSELPSEIVSLLLENSKLTIVWSTPTIANGDEPASPVSSTKPTTTTQTAKDLLISTNNELKTVAANVMDENESNIINKMRLVISKVIADQNYNYMPEADAIKSEYSALTSEERSDLKTMILVHMNKNNLLKLQKMFKL